MFSWAPESADFQRGEASVWHEGSLDLIFTSRHMDTIPWKDTSVLKTSLNSFSRSYQQPQLQGRLWRLPGLSKPRCYKPASRSHRGAGGLPCHWSLEPRLAQKILGEITAAGRKPASPAVSWALLTCPRLFQLHLRYYLISPLKYEQTVLLVLSQRNGFRQGYKESPELLGS